MKASPYKRLEKAVKRAYLKPLTLLRHGTLRPEKTRLHGARHWIHIDPSDPCALKKLVEEPLRGRVSSHLMFWRDFKRHLDPDIVVDVGMGYGECLFGLDYEAHTNLFGVEANPRLVPFLEQTRAGHPGGERTTLCHCIVSDVAADEVPFFVNPDWSGSSSALREINSGPHTLEFGVPARTLDSIIPLDLARGKTLLFKLDIGGYEGKALRGFVEILASAGRSVGFVNFDAQYIAWAGQSPVEYLAWLQQRFHTYFVISPATPVLRRVEGFADLPKLHGDINRVHVDLVLVGKQSPDNWLPPEWTLAGSPST